jgi:hypothetical protein
MTSLNINWNKGFSALVEAQLDMLLSSDQASSEEVKSIASQTSALPVYSDMSGTLCISPEGVILFFDSESKQITEITDVNWRIIAAVSAAEKIPGLRNMLPNRPLTALTCSSCLGMGRQQGNLLCGVCFGLGWIL